MSRSEPRRLRWALLPLLALSGACATVPPPPPTSSPATPQQTTAPVVMTTLWTGRFAATWRDPKAAVAAAGANAEDRSVQRVSGLFQLIERVAPPGSGQTSAITLDVSSLLGSTLARARTDAGGASLDLADGRRYTAVDAEALTDKVLGWRVPVARLPGWLRGEESLPGDRWQVGIEELRGHRPARVTLRWPADGPEAVSLKLLVDDPETREE